jgi:hypothetical protein
MLSKTGNMPQGTPRVVPAPRRTDAVGQEVEILVDRVVYMDKCVKHHKVRGDVALIYTPFVVEALIKDGRARLHSDAVIVSEQVARDLTQNDETYLADDAVHEPLSEDSAAVNDEAEKADSVDEVDVTVSWSDVEFSARTSEILEDVFKGSPEAREISPLLVTQQQMATWLGGSQRRAAFAIKAIEQARDKHNKSASDE